MRGRAFWGAAVGATLAVLVAGVLWTWPRWWPRASEEQGASAKVEDVVTPRSEREFVRNWAESERAVGQSEKTTSFIHVGDEWNRELDALKHSLTDLEARENPTAPTKGDKK